MDALFAMSMGIVIVFLLLILVPYILFLVNLQNTLAACSQENRAMEPGLVWLNLIPIFSLFWLFWTVIKIRDSLQKEYESRSLDTKEVTDTYNMGLGLAISSVAGIIPVIGLITGIAALVFFIIYWSKTSGCRKTLSS
tara:strand:- start:73 stop:486 length:414 start_codon:yes stop_codon:yes gene_type:complete